jgi:hypothetical protein
LPFFGIKVVLTYVMVPALSVGTLRGIARLLAVLAPT